MLTLESSEEQKAKEAKKKGVKNGRNGIYQGLIRKRGTVAAGNREADEERFPDGAEICVPKQPESGSENENVAGGLPSVRGVYRHNQ